MAEYKLVQKIISISVSKKWDDAKLEWSLDEVYEGDELEECLCGHYPIKEICVIKNKINKETAVVGNCCVKKFMGLPSDKIFNAAKRIRKNNRKSLNEEAIKYAYEKKWINDWEYKFSINTINKRQLTENQIEKRLEINNKFLARMRKS